MEDVIRALILICCVIIVWCDRVEIRNLRRQLQHKTQQVHDREEQ